MLFVTLISVLFAIAMSVVAWRATSEQRRRSEARVALLSREIHGGMFEPSARPSDGGSRWGLALAIGAFAVAVVAAAVIVFSGDSPSESTVVSAGPQAVAAQVAPAAPAAPLELIALSHERLGGQLTVRGVVRNPAAGTPMDRLTAVVFVFDRDGGFITSARAAVASPSLIPGGESPFSVAVPVAGDIGRYRVSFRSDEKVVSHVDRRSAS